MHVHVGRGRRVLQRLLDVGALEVGVLREARLERPSRGDQPDRGFNSDAQTADAGLALELVGLDGDAVERHRFLPARRCLVVRRGFSYGSTVRGWLQPRLIFDSRSLRTARRTHPGSYRRPQQGG